MKKIINYLMYGNYNKQIFIENKDTINENNYARLRYACVCTMILNLMSYIFMNISNSTLVYGGLFLYLFMFLFTVAYYIFLRTFKKWSKKNVSLLFYIYALINLFCYETLGVDYNLSATASVICMIYVIIPLIFVDIPIRYTIITFIFTSGLCYDTLHLKQIDYALMDCLNCCSAFLIGIFSFYFNFNSRIGKAVQLKQMELERNSDYLTGLKNRIATEYDITDHINNAGQMSVMLVVDLDDFKKINDTYGHSEGDRVLIDVAEVMKNVFRKEDYISRIGGDEFVIFLKDVPNKKFVNDKAKLLMKKIGEITVMDKHIIGCSIGIAFTGDCNNYRELFLRADKAMYIAKNSGKNNYEIYSEKKETI